VRPVDLFVISLLTDRIVKIGEARNADNEIHVHRDSSCIGTAFSNDVSAGCWRRVSFFVRCAAVTRPPSQPNKK
jgi:hypothetical protein